MGIRFSGGAMLLIACAIVYLFESKRRLSRLLVKQACRLEVVSCMHCSLDRRLPPAALIRSLRGWREQEN